AHRWDPRRASAADHPHRDAARVLRLRGEIHRERYALSHSLRPVEGEGKAAAGPLSQGVPRGWLYRLGTGGSDAESAGAALPAGGQYVPWHDGPLGRAVG